MKQTVDTETVGAFDENDDLQVIQDIAWCYYMHKNHKQLSLQSCGKWMYFYENDRALAERLCSNAVKQGVVTESKHTNSDVGSGVCCFYLDGNDLEAHRKCITYFMDNNMIRRTKAGKLYNISFKFDSQTGLKEYGASFSAVIKLSDFVNLTTGEFLSDK